MPSPAPLATDTTTRSVAAPASAQAETRAALHWFPGIVLTAAIAIGSMLLSQVGWLQAHGISALTIAIVLGMVIGNTLYPGMAPAADAGVTFSKTRLLRIGIVLYGFRLTFQDIGNVGWSGVAIDAAVLGSTFMLACVLGTRVFGLDRQTSMLIGAGSSICGAAAVMATGPVVEGRAEQVMVAVATVVVFGTLGMFLYPALYELNLQHGFIALSPSAYGIFAGSTVHEVAQVVAAGRAVGEQAGNTAVIAKMVRVMMLAPFLMLLSAYLSKASRGQTRSDDASKRGARRVVVPWFALGFVLVAGFNSLDLLPHGLVAHVNDIDTGLLAMAMAALGLTTHVSAIRKAGVKPLALAATLFVWLLCGGLAINLSLGALVG